MTAMLHSKLSTASEGPTVIGSILRATALLMVGICLLIPCGTEAHCTPEPGTVVQGTAFLEPPDGPVPGAKVTVQGDFLMESAITDREGKFRFSNLEPGTYTVEATYLGLYVEQKITLEAGALLQVTLQLKPPDLTAPPKS